MFGAYQLAPLRLGKAAADGQGGDPMISLWFQIANVTGRLAGLRQKAKSGGKRFLLHQPAELWQLLDVIRQAGDLRQDAHGFPDMVLAQNPHSANPGNQA